MMTTPSSILRQSGYRLPSNYEPYLGPYEPFTPKNEPIKKEEEIPYPYNYTVEMVPESEKDLVRQKFIAEANMRRWKHVYSADIKRSIKK